MDELLKYLSLISFWGWVAGVCFAWWLITVCLSHLIFARSNDPFRATRNGAFSSLFLVILITMLLDWWLNDDLLRTILLGSVVFLLLFVFLLIILRSESSQIVR